MSARAWRGRRAGQWSASLKEAKRQNKHGCSGGLIEVDGCTCDAGPALGIPGVGHRPYCGTAPCPAGCWERLHPDAALTETERLSLRIGAKEDAIHHLVQQIGEDEMVLALFRNGTPPDDTGFADEDECAAFAAAGRAKLADDLGALDIMYGQLAELIAAEQVAA